MLITTPYRVVKHEVGLVKELLHYFLWESAGKQEPDQEAKLASQKMHSMFLLKCRLTCMMEISLFKLNSPRGGEEETDVLPTLLGLHSSGGDC